MLSSYGDMVLSHALKFCNNTEHQLQNFNTTYDLKNIVATPL